MDPSSYPNLAERRKHARVDLQVPAHIFRGSEVIRLTTQNISIGGFYSVCEERFACGEQFDSILDIAGLTRSSRLRARLRCNLRVIRVEAVQPDGTEGGAERFGVAFCIESYHVAGPVSDGAA